MEYLRLQKLDQLILSLKQPVLGICLGMQLMCSSSEENNTVCLGIFDEPVKRFKNNPGSGSTLKIPQIGWNTIYDLKSPLFAGIEDNSYIYLVHSYYAAVGNHTIATSDYITPFSAALHKNNFYGVQFHPEKSGEVGMQLLDLARLTLQRHRDTVSDAEQLSERIERLRARVTASAVIPALAQASERTAGSLTAGARPPTRATPEIAAAGTGARATA